MVVVKHPCYLESHTYGLIVSVHQKVMAWVQVQSTMMNCVKNLSFFYHF